jgi:hypothetical protein
MTFEDTVEHKEPMNVPWLPPHLVCFRASSLALLDPDSEVLPHPPAPVASAAHLVSGH